ncbi:N-acetylmuramoyl-L-alanine amidase family protein [Sulfuriroseicoccus oceanibius]|uniref:N-acetylmuramoyl-L-alanine amidase n=1 Tax=Sulfuriroseicoccus oceanibius TaxID=2707525 RepID=A0A6B3LFI9_9BACT|nr:N-acetylmuramoyl-L-alanine amidase [Sulfuriroseicoccus oceanibius]QQL45657.1 N-acetylmuramoyl-L-alanine amidase [Sulfuriroseicoccus oceanibius]
MTSQPLTHRITARTALIRGLLCLLCMAVAALAVPQAHARKIDTVVIDAGHGGFNLGQRNGQVYEKWLALDVSLRLDKYLRKKGVKTVLTRRSDVFISLPERVRIANRYSKNSIFVSVHFNGASNRNAHGLETFHYSRNSKELAARIQTEIVRATRRRDRGVKQARFHVIRNTKQQAVLVECGFLTNARELKLCKTGKYRQAMAEAIGRGVLKHLKAIN